MFSSQNFKFEDSSEYLKNKIFNVISTVFIGTKYIKYAKKNGKHECTLYKINSSFAVP